MDNKEIIRKLEKVVWDWKGMHQEISEVLKSLDKESEEYKIVSEMAKAESQLIEEAQSKFEPLMQKLKERFMTNRT